MTTPPDTMRRVALAVLLLALFATDTHALPIPAEQWTPRARLWLSRAQVAEAGWIATTDHDVMAWVLARRWRALQSKFPAIGFTDAVRSYCAGLGNRTPSRRQLWVRALTTDGSPPSGWPSHVSWSAHLPRWRAVVERTDEWAAGRVKDPSRGRADHWGATRLDADVRRAQRAVAAGRWRVLVIPGTELANGKRGNQFYQIL